MSENNHTSNKNLILLLIIILMLKNLFKIWQNVSLKRLHIKKFMWRKSNILSSSNYLKPRNFWPMEIGLRWVLLKIIFNISGQNLKPATIWKITLLLLTRIKGKWSFGLITSHSQHKSITISTMRREFWDTLTNMSLANIQLHNTILIMFVWNKHTKFLANVTKQLAYCNHNSSRLYWLLQVYHNWNSLRDSFNNRCSLYYVDLCQLCWWCHYLLLS